MSRLALALCFAALVLPAAGCGSAPAPGSAGAGVAPAAAQVFVSIDTSFDSASWKAGRTLLAKFPDGNRAVAWLADQLAGHGVDFARDVQPALGPETDLVGLDLSGAGTFVGLTQPADPAKLDALLAKSDPPLVSRQVGGWTAFSDSPANLDEFERLQKQGTLDSVDAYRTVSDKVAGDALVRLYLAPAALGSTPLAGALGSDAPSLALSLSPQADGLHVEGAAAPATSDLFGGQFKAELPAQVPGGVLLYADGHDLERSLGALRDVLAQAAPGFESQLGRAEAQLGVSLDEDVFPLFSGESALYVRPGFPIPEVTLVTQVDDGPGAVATLDKLVKGLAGHLNGASPVDVTVDGVQARQLSVSGLVSVYYAAFDGHLVVTTSTQGITDLRQSANRLADDQAFKDATAGMPEQTSGFVYVDLSKALPAALGLLGAGGQSVPDQAQANLAPLRSLLLYGGRDGNVATFAGLLAIQ